MFCITPENMQTKVQATFRLNLSFWIYSTTTLYSMKEFQQRHTEQIDGNVKVDTVYSEYPYSSQTSAILILF